MNEWISVDDERKSHGELVDVYCKGRRVRVTNCTYDQQKNIFHHFQKGYVFDATHWMPLPELPQ